MKKVPRILLFSILLLGLVVVAVLSHLPLLSFGTGNLELEFDDLWVAPDGVRFDPVHDTKTTIVYAGFVGCSQRCPIALQRMNEWGNEDREGHFRFVFLNTDPLVSSNPMKAFMENFPYIEGYTTIHHNPANQVRKMKLLTGVLNLDEHSDWFLVLPPKNSTLSPKILKFPLISLEELKAEILRNERSIFRN